MFLSAVGAQSGRGRTGHAALGAGVIHGNSVSLWQHGQRERLALARGRNIPNVAWQLLESAAASGGNAVSIAWPSSWRAVGCYEGKPR